jgi:hypothetical protein
MIMKFNIFVDEEYPNFSLLEALDGLYEIDDLTFKRWKEVLGDYETVKEEIQKLWRGA